MRVVLVNMPFSSLRFPSFALSQLAAVVEEEHGESCRVDVLYANHLFARLLGVDDYERLASSEYHSTGVGEWVFGGAAFADPPASPGAYLDTYFPDDPDMRALAGRARELAPSFCADLVRDHDLGSADLVGATTMFAQTVPSLALLGAVRATGAPAVTALGGANCEGVMGSALARSASPVDLVFSGPALRSFPEVLRRLAAGDPVARCATVPGVVTARSGRDLLSHVPAAGIERPINDVVVPRFDAFRDAFDGTFAGTGVDPILFFETSRGCWWGERAHCTFCGLNGAQMGFREMTPERAVEQFTTLFEHAPWCRSYHCVDNILPTGYIDSVFPNLHTPPGGQIFFEVKVGKLSRDQLEVLADAGVTLLQPGIEALHSRTLKLMRKGVSSFQNITFLAHCKELGIEPLWSLLVGFPGEAEDVYRKYDRDLPSLSHLPPPMGVFTVRFDRFSPYHTEADSYGLKLAPFRYYPMIFPYPDDVLENLAYYFEDHGDEPYAEAVRRWHPTLRERVGHWRDGWSDGAVPRVRLEHDGRDWTVLDTRPGGPGRSTLDDAEAEALLDLTEPVRLDRIPRRSPAADPGVLDGLQARDLVFEENGRIMSLVENLLAPRRVG